MYVDTTYVDMYVDVYADMYGTTLHRANRGFHRRLDQHREPQFYTIHHGRKELFNYANLVARPTNLL
jgi:hypothetical protein